MVLRRVGLGFCAAFALASGPASACDGGLSRLGAVSSVTVQFGGRKPEMPLENADQVRALVGFFRRLGADWKDASTAPAGNDGVIRFYETSGSDISVWLTGSGFKTDSCYRKATQGELDELLTILTSFE
jgi:hypothetical protein